MLGDSFQQSVWRSQILTPQMNPYKILDQASMEIIPSKFNPLTNHELSHYLLLICGIYSFRLKYCNRWQTYWLQALDNLNNLQLNMADQEGGAPFQFTKEGEKQPGKSSRDYTGRGYAVYPNGDQYDGDYVDGIRQGKGKYLYANGDRYEGDFKNNKKHGIGKLSYKDKGEYYGQWENGVKHGEGTYQYQNKDSYSGWWQFGQKKGQGTYYYASTGMKLSGEWDANKIVKGKWVFPNGTYYEGNFKENKPDGQGTWKLNNGNELEGSYKQTQIANEEDPDNPKVNIKLDWQSKAGIADSAWKVNAHENF